MLLEFRVANFRSFAEEQVFSFIADKDQTLLQNTTACAQSPTGRVVRLAVLYGPNGGGKTTLVRAVETMLGLIVNSARGQLGDRLSRIEPFKLDQALASAPSRFELTFVAPWSDPDAPGESRPVRYQYGFAADPEQVHEEWLLAYPHGQPQTWFDRTTEGIAFPSRRLKGDRRRFNAETRSNALFLSVAAQQNQAQIKPVFDWLRTNLRTLGSGAWQAVGEPVVERIPLTARHTSRLLAEGTSPEVRRAFVRILQNADVGIADVVVQRLELDESDLPPGIPPEVRRMLLTRSGEHHEVRTVHLDRSGHRVEWSLSDESEGTQRLYCLMGPWLETANQGYVVFVDDLLSNVHPKLTRELVEAFLAAGGVAQIVLTTHDTHLLDSSMLRRDQIWFVEKGTDGASRLYSLLEYRPRKDESFERGYLAGRYGALPFVGDVHF